MQNITCENATLPNCCGCGRASSCLVYTAEEDAPQYFCGFSFSFWDDYDGYDDDDDYSDGDGKSGDV